MTEPTPTVLYHGSSRLLDVLHPGPARGVGPSTDTMNAIYASHIRDFAIPFAFSFVGGPHLTYSWKMDFTDRPRITILSGAVDFDRPGYLYWLPPDSFLRVDEHQWVSQVPVVPTRREEVRPRDYAHWILPK